MKIKLIVAVAVVAAVLAACGGDHNDNNSSAAATPPADTFLSQVIALIAGTDETSDPKSTDTVTATAPETTEPAPII